MNAMIKPARMSLEAFLAWEARQDVKYELVNGRPRMMAGAAKGHNRICANVLATLHARLRGKPCQPYGSDMKFISPTGNARYPDVQVDCAPFRGDDLVSEEPRLIVEVLSPSNDWHDMQRRLADYQAHPSVRHILIVSTQTYDAQVYSLGDGGWGSTMLDGLEGGFEFASIGASLSMAEIYEGVAFEEAGAPT
jgi:Uma2 family endonuclease